MNRRNLLKSAASVATGAGLLAAGPHAVLGAGTKSAASTDKLLPVPFIETGDSAFLFCKEWGTGKPVLFLHSWAVHSDLWQYQMIDLSNRGIRCIAYDMRGHGRSSDPGRGFNFDNLADDLHTVIERFGLREACVVGHSVSCGVIVRYLLRHGSSRISRAVLVSPSMQLKTDDDPQGSGRAASDQARPSWIKDFPKWLGENARPFFVPETSQEMVQFGIDMCLQASLKALLDVHLADKGTDFRAALPKVHVPTLVIHGDRDHSVPADRGREVAKLIPGAEFKLYEGAPHGLMFTHMDRLNADLVAFTKG